VRAFKPDIIVGVSSIRASHVSRILRKPSISLDDTEHAKLVDLLYMPFTDIVLTPSSYKKDLGGKHVRYDGFTQFAHTHPRRFKPDPSVLESLGLREGEPYIVLRLVSWDASHDIGHHGIADPLRVVQELERYGRVFISSESRLDERLEPYRLKLPPEKFLDVLYYSTLYFGEGGTTAIECALMGTHGVLISTLAKYCGVYDDLGARELVWTYENAEDGLAQARRLLARKDLKEEGRMKLRRLLDEKIDLTGFLVWFVENYPRSVEETRSGPGAQDRFRGAAVVNSPAIGPA
jgi:predicted glycosyltransferase